MRDFQQIAGRAGRKGFDTQGSVVAQAPEHVIENLKLAQKEAKGGKKSAAEAAAEKGYVHWDKTTFERLQARPPEPLVSRFEVTHGMLLNVLQGERAGGAEGYQRLVRLDHPLARLATTSSGSNRKEAAACFRTLRDAGIVELVQTGEDGSGAASPWRPTSSATSRSTTRSRSTCSTRSTSSTTSRRRYALDVLTLVESILENPDVILYAQLDKLKGEKIAELKAQGMEYDERMAELEKLEYPKPNREFIYGTFNAFAAKHPWVGDENIRPKSIAREMYERFMSFHDYVREYGLQRSEGVLLRYLSDVYKALVQTVPERYRNEELEDIIEYLRAMVRAVDSSLLDEWERMKNPGEAILPRAQAPEHRPQELTDDPRAFAAHVRNELYRLVRLLGNLRYPEALELLTQGEGEAWTAAKLEAAMAPYFAEHGQVVLTPKARRPEYTLLKQTGPRQWDAQQRLLDLEGHADWMLDCAIDLTGRKAEDGPLLTLRRIGT